MRWIITYDYRLHRRHGTRAQGCGAIFMDVAKGTKTELIDVDPVSWFAAQEKRWKDLEEQRDTPGEAMTGIVVRFAYGQSTSGSEK